MSKESKLRERLNQQLDLLLVKIAREYNFSLMEFNLVKCIDAIQDGSISDKYAETLADLCAALADVSEN